SLKSPTRECQPSLPAGLGFGAEMDSMPPTLPDKPSGPDRPCSSRVRCQIASAAEMTLRIPTLWFGPKALSHRRRPKAPEKATFPAASSPTAWHVARANNRATKAPQAASLLLEKLPFLA